MSQRRRRRTLFPAIMVQALSERTHNEANQKQSFLSLSSEDIA